MIKILKLVNKTVLQKSAVFFVIAVTVTLLGTVITYFVNPDVKGVMDSIGTNTPDQLKESAGIEKVWRFIVNNGFMVPLQMFFLALVPVQFLYLLNILSTALLPGILFGVVLRMDVMKGTGIIISALPHYIVEVFAFCLLAAVLFELNRAVRATLRNLFKKDKEQVSLAKEILGTVKIYGAIILPMIIAAAFLETYIADLLFNLFQ